MSSTPRKPLRDVPWEAIDRVTGLPRHGSYRGALRAVELEAMAPDRIERLTRHKRWIWATVSTREFVLAFAVVDLGYATSMFGYAWSASEGMLIDTAQLGLPGLASVRRDGVDRVRARFRSAPLAPRARIAIAEPVGGQRIEVSVSLPSLELTGFADLRSGPPPMTAIAPVAGGILNVTEKRVLAPFLGSALVRGRRFLLDGADFGWDVTEGLLARRTRWKWAFIQGRTTEGVSFALNLVEGFVGEPECTLWLDGQVIPVGEGRFEHTEGEPLRPWKVKTTCGTVAFEVTPTAQHADQQDLRVIKSRFFQALGLGSGVLSHEGRTHRFEATPIIVEDQDMLW
jgi:hypothetical protein